MTVEASVRITNPIGLHARPAVKLAQLAARFDADVQVRVDNAGAWIKARSTAKLMKLKARANSVLYFRAQGEQASDALGALVALVKRDFDENPAGSEHAASPATPSLVTAPAGHGSGSGAEVIVAAEIASPGMADGVIFQAPKLRAAPQVQATPTEEAQVLEAAVGRALEGLRELGRGSDPLGVAIVEVQIALLEDRGFIAPLMEAVTAGTAAETAWRRLMDAEIADFETAEDGYFRGRASDLRDLRDRVLAQLRSLENPVPEIPEGAILCLAELAPSRFLELDWRRLRGIVMLGGSQTSHVSMLARARSLPLLINARTDLLGLPSGTAAIIDAEGGRLVLRPAPQTRRQYEGFVAVQQARAREIRRYLPKPGRTGTGVRVRVYIDVDDPELLANVDPGHCDGIGLTRSEFLFHREAGLPDEEAQYRAYCRLLDWSGGRPVTVRTLDAGGDKPIPGLTPHDEGNPFLGVRGLRLSLARPEVFRVQLRALARAAARGPLRVLLPMVTLASELEAVRGLFAQQVEALRRAGTEALVPPLGIMVEVPAAALTIAEFKADFMSIGSNDLVQYVMAAGRDCPGVARFQDPLHPGVLELIGRVARHCAQTHREASLCGAMAAQPECLAALLRLGIRALSVPPGALADTKAGLARCNQP